MMKIALIWSVLGLIWVSGSNIGVAAREIYSGLNYEFTPIHQPNPVRFQSFIPEADNYYDVIYKRFKPTWQRRSVPMDGGLQQDDVTEYLEKTDFDSDADYNELVKLYKLLQYARNHGLTRLPVTGRRAEWIKNIEEKFEKLKEVSNMNDIDFLDKYVLNPAPEETRMYPQDDSDLDWNDAEDKIYTDTEEHVPSISEQQRLHYENALYGNYGKNHAVHNAVHETIMKDGQNEKIENTEGNLDLEGLEQVQIKVDLNTTRQHLYIPEDLKSINHRPHQSTHNAHAGHENYVFKENELFPDSDMSSIPIAENPSEFGYGPSDSRFFEKTGEEVGQEKVNEFDNTITKTEKPKMTDATKRPNVVKIKERYKNNRFLETDDPTSYTSKLVGNEADGVAVKQNDISSVDTTGIYIIAVVAGISAAGTVAMIAVGIGWFNLQKHMKNAEDSDYPSYGVVGPNKKNEKKLRDEAGDKKLAQSAQMYHYQHQKQQIIAMGRNPQGGHGSMSDTDEEEDEEGNYTVYECPGLASIEGPLEVKNPLFDDDQLATPSQTPLKTTNGSTNSTK